MRNAVILTLTLLFGAHCSTKEIPGRLVDVGGRRMHIVCVGQGARRAKSLPICSWGIRSAG
jgi:hypothetical protein